MDKQFTKEEKARRKRELEGNKTKQERNRSLLAQGVQAVVILSLGFAVASLANSKTYIPVVTVLGADGEVLKQRVIDKDNVGKEEAVTEKVLFDMIRACNTFDLRRKQQLSDTCHTYMTPDVAAEYEKELSPENPTNPYLSLGEKDWIEAQPYMMNKVGDEYQVSFNSLKHRWGDNQPVEHRYLATIKVNHTLVPRALGERWENPFGTLATLYRKSEELSRR